MRWFHLLHLLATGILGLTILVVITSTIALLRPATSKLERTRQHLSDILATPAPAPVIVPFKPTEKLTLKFAGKEIATESALLLRPITPDEALFLPSFQPTSFTQLQEFAWSNPPSKRLLTWDEPQVRSWIASISGTIDTKTEYPRVEYSTKAKPNFNIFAGKAGIGMDEDETTKAVLRSRELNTTIAAPSRPVNPPLTKEEVEKAQTRASKILVSPLSFTAHGRNFTLPLSTLASLINLPNGFSQEKIESLLVSWAKEFDQQVVEPELAFDGKRITTFKAPIEGRKLDTQKNTELLLTALEALEETGNKETKELVVTRELPKITLDSLNSLGITERIGRGDSDYAHSIPNRIFNVSLASKQIHGLIIEPGATFSFNKALGEVSAATGYKQAYVIDRGQTILGDGGGVCQVSSTFFRALLDAGLPIIERRGHSYRVGYYEQNSLPGFDATVSSPHPDLTFLNDTGAPILINAQADSKKLHLYIELYGKFDGRKSEISNYKQWGETAAPPALYQDDPSLPKGVTKQIDFAAGGLKTSFQYKVTYANGDVKNTTYATNYVPWRAVFLRGTR